MPDNKIHGNSSTHPRWQPADVSRTEDLHRDKKLFWSPSKLSLILQRAHAVIFSSQVAGDPAVCEIWFGKLGDTMSPLSAEL